MQLLYVLATVALTSATSPTGIPCAHPTTVTPPPPALPVDQVTLIQCRAPDPFLRLLPRSTQSPECRGPTQQSVAASSDGVVFRSTVNVQTNGLTGFAQSFIVRVRLNCRTTENPFGGATQGIPRTELSPRVWGLCVAETPPTLPVSLNPDGSGVCQNATPALPGDDSIIITPNIPGGPRGIQMKRDLMSGATDDLFGSVCPVVDTTANMFAAGILQGNYSETSLGGDSHYISFSSDASPNCSTAFIASPQGRMTTEVQEIGLTVQCNAQQNTRERFVILTGVGTRSTLTASGWIYEFVPRLVDPATGVLPNPFTGTGNDPGIPTNVNPLVVVVVKVVCPTTIFSPNNPAFAPVFSPAPAETRGTALCGAHCPLPLFPASSQVGVTFRARCCSCFTNTQNNQIQANLNDCYVPRPPNASRREGDSGGALRSEGAEGEWGGSEGRDEADEHPLELSITNLQSGEWWKALYVRIRGKAIQMYARTVSTASDVAVGFGGMVAGAVGGESVNAHDYASRVIDLSAWEREASSGEGVVTVPIDSTNEHAAADSDSEGTSEGASEGGRVDVSASSAVNTLVGNEVVDASVGVEGYNASASAATAAANRNGVKVRAAHTAQTPSVAIDGALILDIDGCQAQPNPEACCNQAFIDIFCSAGVEFGRCTCGGVGVLTCPTRHNHNCPESKKALLGLLGIIGIIPLCAALCALMFLCCMARSKPVVKGRREPIGAPPSVIGSPLGATITGATVETAPVFF